MNPHLLHLPAAGADQPDLGQLQVHPGVFVWLPADATPSEVLAATLGWQAEMAEDLAPEIREHRPVPWRATRYRD